MPALGEAIQAGRLKSHADAISAVQAEARSAAGQAAQAFDQQGDQADSRALASLVDGEMPLAAADLEALGAASGARTPSASTLLARIDARQRAILDALIAILGEAAARADPRAKRQQAEAPEHPDARDARDAVARARDDLKDFMREQERILARSRTLAEAKPIDLSDGQAQALGALARDEAAQAKFLEDKLSDFSKLPTEDFSDASLGKEVNQVWQDITEADESLYKKSVQMAVPQEQNGLELAKELENNLEKWMANHRDNVQWAMEEALKPADVPISELPKQLEDIVGDLLDKEDEMSPQVRGTSPARGWTTSTRARAGRDAADGPISNMSAKGITGNQLPNQDEIGGRSGEGRNGLQPRADGAGQRRGQGRARDAVAPRARAVRVGLGQGCRMLQTDHGGPTGGGKVSGAAAEGLRGPVPPPLAHAMERLARSAGARCGSRRGRSRSSSGAATCPAAMSRTRSRPCAGSSRPRTARTSAPSATALCRGGRRAARRARHRRSRARLGASGAHRPRPHPPRPHPGRP